MKLSWMGIVVAVISYFGLGVGTASAVTINELESVCTQYGGSPSILIIPNSTGVYVSCECPNGYSAGVLMGSQDDPPSYEDLMSYYEGLEYTCFVGPAYDPYVPSEPSPGPFPGTDPPIVYPPPPLGGPVGPA